VLEVRGVELKEVEGGQEGGQDISLQGLEGSLESFTQKVESRYVI
jgi:hypothetical protein